MKIQVSIEGREEPIELELEGVRQHFAFVEGGRAYCLDDGSLYCIPGIEKLTPGSLQAVLEMARQKVGETVAVPDTDADFDALNREDDAAREKREDDAVRKLLEEACKIVDNDPGPITLKALAASLGIVEK